MFEIVLPGTLINVPIFVMVDTLVPLVATKCALEDISIEESLLTFYFWVVVPETLEDCSFAEVVDSLALTSSLMKYASVAVLVDKLKLPFTMR